MKNKKEVLVFIIVFAVIIIAYGLSYFNYTNSTITQVKTEVEESEDPMNSMLLQHTGGEYFCWKKHGKFLFVSGDNRDLEFRYEGSKYRLYIIGDNTRIINFRGVDWDKAAYYLGTKPDKCIESLSNRVGVK